MGNPLFTLGPNRSTGGPEPTLSLRSAAIRGATGSRLFVAPLGRLVPSILLGIVAMTNLAQADPTPLTTLRSQTRDLLREEAIAPKGDKKDAAIAALCDMYVILRYDSRYQTSEMLRGDASKLRRRLLTIARARKSKLRRDRIPRPSSLASEVDSAIKSALASQDDDQKGFAKPAGSGGGALLDEGWRLVELIERIVAPDFWESRGGPGSIRYFAIRRVLVVRATTDVHEQIKDLLTALR